MKKTKFNVNLRNFKEVGECTKFILILQDAVRQVRPPLKVNNMAVIPLEINNKEMQGENYVTAITQPNN